MTGGDGDESGGGALAPATPQKQQQADRPGVADSHSPGREDAVMVAGARARRQEEGAAASRARRAARRRQREAAGLQTPPRGLDISVDSPASSVGSHDPQHDSELEVSMELDSALETTATDEAAASTELARSEGATTTWMQRLCYCLSCSSCRHLCCCCSSQNGAWKADRLQNSVTGSYGLVATAPQQDTSSSGCETSQLHDTVSEMDDDETEQHGEQNRLLMALDESMDQTSATTEFQFSPQPSPPRGGGSTPPPPTSASTIGNLGSETTSTDNDDLRSCTPSVLMPGTPGVPPHDENLQGGSSPSGLAPKPAHRDDSTEQQAWARNGSLPAIVEKGKFAAKARWERAVRKAEAVAAFVQGDDGCEGETHWQLSPDGDDVVPRDYAETLDDTVPDLHPSQRRVIVSIRTRSEGLKETKHDEENPESERDAPQSEAHLADSGRHARASDR